MAILSPQDKKQRNLFFILSTLAFIWLIWFGKDFFIKILPPPPPSQSFQKIEINFEVLKNPLLKNLVSFEEIPPFEGEVGREDPFVPFGGEIGRENPFLPY